MNRSLPLLALGCMLSVSPAEARLGENLSQCESRYGPVIERRPASVKGGESDACVFSKSGITVLIEFKSGLAWRLLFRMSGMTATELETLLRANMPEGGWSSAIKHANQDFRLSADRRRIAVFTPGKERTTEMSSLEIATRDYGSARRAQYQESVLTAIATVESRKEGQRMKDF